MKKALLLIATTLLYVCMQQDARAQQEDWLALFDGRSLEGWRVLGGGATYAVVDGVIVGTTGPGPNTFLASDALYSNFILELEAKVDSGLNSGVQFRSNAHSTYMNARVHGYQLELDTSSRKWTGGIYDEARRGWLYPVTRNKDSAEVFRVGEWNRLRIEAIGSTIRTWVNGIPVAHLLDDMTATGFIALQVHSVEDKSLYGRRVMWRNIRIKTTDLDRARRPVPATEDVEQFNYIANTLSEAEQKAGWRLLWDGKTTRGWRSATAERFPQKGWKIEDGVLSVLASGGAEAAHGGDIITEREYSDFDVQLDFRITKGANSGIKYFVDPDLLKGRGSAIGLEFQILDDKYHPDARQGTAGNRTVGSLYDLIPAVNLSEPGRKLKRVKPPGQWNRARVIVRGNRVEHWLNHIKVVEYNRGTQVFAALVARSKYAKWPNFGRWEKGPILLQDHGDLVSFRSIKIRELTPEER